MSDGGERQQRGAGSGALTLVLLAGVVALALGLRLAFLRSDSTFQRTDEVMFLLNAFKLHALVEDPHLGTTVREAFWMFAFPWGYPILLFVWTATQIGTRLGFPVTEFTAVAPFAVLGGVAPVFVFLLGRRVVSVPVGIAAALAVAVFPSHVAQSRTIAAWILASNLMMLSLLLFLRYRETQRPRDAWLFGLALAVYLPSDNVTPGTIIFLMALAVAESPGSWFERMRAAWHLFWRLEVLLLPLLTVAPLIGVHIMFVATGRPTYGFVGHYFVSKSAPGVHVGELASALLTNGGAAMTALMVAGALWAAVSLIRRDRAQVFALWTLAFGVPTALLVNPGGTLVRGYTTPIVIPLVLLGSTAVFEIAHRLGGMRRAFAAVAVASVCGFTLASIPSRIYDQAFLFPRDPIGLWGGEMYPNNGAKSAGYFIRTEMPPQAVVRSDLRLFVGKYYFHRRTLLVGPEPAATAVNGAPHADVLALTRQARSTIDLSGYHLAATITHRGQAVFFVYGREPLAPRTIPTEEFDARFDREFGRPALLSYPLIWGD